jgi:branched-chain amino acid transport system substrate-binding protein
MSKTTKTILGLVILIIIVLVIYLGINKKTTQVEEKPAPKETVRATIKIGAILPLTGDLAEYGKDELSALDLFIEEWNKRNEKKIKLLVEDSKSDPKEAISALNKLLLEKPKIFLTLGSSISLALQPVINEKQIPTITVAANPKTANGYMIQNLPTSNDYVNLISEEILVKNVTKLGLIFRNDELGKGVRDSLVYKLKEKVEIIEEAVSPDETDFRTLITKIKSKNPEAIFILHTGKKLGLLISQIRNLMGDIIIYSTLEVNYPEVKETAGANYYNIKYSDLNVDYNQPNLKTFKENYVAKFNREPSLDSILAYNEMLILSSCLDYEKESLLRCLFGVKIDGLTGQLSVLDNRIDYSKSILIKEIK